jgi:hypothetical protein
VATTAAKRIRLLIRLLATLMTGAFTHEIQHGLCDSFDEHADFSRPDWAKFPDFAEFFRGFDR